MSAKNYLEKLSRAKNRLALFKIKNMAYWNCNEVWQERLRYEAWQAWKNGEGYKWFFIAFARWLEIPIKMR